MSPAPRPPRWAEAWVRMSLPSDEHGRAVVGDLYEEYADVCRDRGRLISWGWYWTQAIAIGVGYGRPGRVTLRDLLSDVRHSLRSLRKSPVFTTSVIGTLALGIGVGTAIFTVVDSVVLRPLPFPEPDRLVRVWASNEEQGGLATDMLYSDVEAVARGVEGLVGVVGFSSAPRTMLDERGQNGEDVVVARTTGSFFGTFGVVPQLGGLYSPDDRSQRDAVVISNGLWQRRFAGDPSVVGRSIHIDTSGYRVLGVLPKGLSFPEQADVWRPLTTDEMEDDDREVLVFGRLASDASVAAVSAELQGVAAGLAEATPGTHRGYSAWAQPLQSMVVRDHRTALLTFLCAVGLILVITSANTANLLIARAADRRHEVAVRTALGASRARVARAHMIESLLLAAGGGMVGLVGGRWVLVAILAVAPRLPRMDAIELDLRIVAIMALVTTTVGVLFGVGPALHAASTQPRDALRDGTTGSGRSKRRQRVQSGLVVTEVAISTALAVVAVLLSVTFQTVVRHDRGFESERLVAFDIDPMHAPQPGDERIDYFDRLSAAVTQLPGVVSVGLASHTILEQRGLDAHVEVDGFPPPEHAEHATTRIVTEGYFSTSGIPLRSGRLFAGDAGSEVEAELVVNERFVREFMPPETDPVGAAVTTEFATGRIVGVVGNVSPSFGEEAKPIMYVPFQRLTLPGGWLMVRTTGDPRRTVPDVWEAVRTFDQNILATRSIVMDEAVRASVASERFNMLIVLSFAGLALGLAAVGIYGMTSYSVAARREEMGIRRALGATRPRVAREVVGRALGLTGLGVTTGVVGASLAGGLFSSLVVGVLPTDPAVVVSVVALLGVVAVLSTVPPVTKAVGIEPTEALRSD